MLGIRAHVHVHVASIIQCTSIHAFAAFFIKVDHSLVHMELHVPYMYVHYYIIHTMQHALVVLVYR